MATVATLQQVNDKYLTLGGIGELPLWVVSRREEFFAPSYALQVDRNSDGDFSDADEEIAADVFQSRGIVTYRGREFARATAPPRVGEFAAELNNRDDDYSPGSTVEAGREVRLQGPVGPVLYDLWRGFLQRPVQHPQLGRQSTTIRALGLFTRAQGQEVSTALYQNITTDVAIGHVLDALGWGAGLRTLDVGKTTLAWWWLDTEDALEALADLVYSEGPGAAIYEGEDGKIIFHNRHHLLETAASNTIQTTIRSLGASPNIAKFEEDKGIDDVINVATLNVRRRSVDATSTIWELGETVELGNSEALSYVVRDVDGNPFQSAIEPVEDTDFTVSAGAVTPSLDRTSGGVITLTMTAGAAGATVTGLQLRADTVSIKSETQVTNRVDTSASIAKHGERRIPDHYTPRQEIAVSTMQDFTDALVGWYQDGRPRIVVSIENQDAEALLAQFSRNLDDRIRVIAETGNFSVDDEFYIFGIRQKIRSQAMVRTEFEAEQVTGTEYAAWGEALWGTAPWGF